MNASLYIVELDAINGSHHVTERDFTAREKNGIRREAKLHLMGMSGPCVVAAILRWEGGEAEAIDPTLFPGGSSDA